MIQKFLKAHWLGLMGLALVAFLMCCDVEFLTETNKVDADGPYVMTRIFGTDQGDLIFSVYGTQWDKELKRGLHRPTLGSLWLERRGDFGKWEARFPLWILGAAIIAGMLVVAAWPTPRPKPQEETPPAAPPATTEPPAPAKDEAK